MKNFYRKIGMVFLMILFCFCSVTINVKAQTLVDINEKAELIIEYQIPKAEFSLYKVADVTENYKFVVTDQFARYGIDFDVLNSDEWKELSETLAGYVNRDNLEPLAVGVADEYGRLEFEDLTVGAYLVVGKHIQDEVFIHRCKPFLAFLPLEKEDGRWDYYPIFSPKSSEEPIELQDLTVLKIWKDEGFKENRPIEITIQLLRNGEIYGEIILSEENNWKHTWYDLSSEYSWQIIEKEVPKGYTVQVVQKGTIYEVVNSAENQPEIPDKLPQTGQIWWPVPILVVAGLLFFMVGWVQRRTNHEN